MENLWQFNRFFSIPGDWGYKAGKPLLLIPVFRDRLLGEPGD